MLRVSRSVITWHCPRLQCEVELQVESLCDHETGNVRARKVTCDMVHKCHADGAVDAGASGQGQCPYALEHTAERSSQGADG